MISNFRFQISDDLHASCSLAQSPLHRRRPHDGHGPGFHGADSHQHRDADDHFRSAGLEHYSWVASIYLLACTVSMPLYGRLADALGASAVILFAIGLFCIASVFAAASHSIVPVDCFPRAARSWRRRNHAGGADDRRRYFHRRRTAARAGFFQRRLGNGGVGRAGARMVSYQDLRLAVDLLRQSSVWRAGPACA